MLDEYGTVTKEGLVELKGLLERDERVTFSYSDNRIDAYILTIIKNPNVIGNMPFFGQINKGDYIVSVHGRGTFHFSGERELHGNYVAEKLNLDEAGGNAIAVVLNTVLS